MAAIKRILYVDSDSEARLLMDELVAPHQLDAVATDQEARALVYQNSYDLYIVSGGGPASSGVALCEWLQRIDGRTPIVFCSSNATARYQKAAVAAGAVRYLVKPLDPPLLRSTLSLLLKLTELESTRAMGLEQKAIDEELLRRSQQLRETAALARQLSDEAVECMLRARAYRAFREGGGNRANFERMWSAGLRQAFKEKL